MHCITLFKATYFFDLKCSKFFLCILSLHRMMSKIIFCVGEKNFYDKPHGHPGIFK